MGSVQIVCPRCSSTNVAIYLVDVRQHQDGVWFSFSDSPSDEDPCEPYGCPNSEMAACIEMDWACQECEKLHTETGCRACDNEAVTFVVKIDEHGLLTTELNENMHSQNEKCTSALRDQHEPP